MACPVCGGMWWGEGCMVHRSYTMPLLPVVRWAMLDGGHQFGSACSWVADAPLIECVAGELCLMAQHVVLLLGWWETLRDCAGSPAHCVPAAFAAACGCIAWPTQYSLSCPSLLIRPVCLRSIFPSFQFDRCCWRSALSTPPQLIGHTGCAILLCAAPYVVS